MTSKHSVEQRNGAALDGRGGGVEALAAPIRATVRKDRTRPSVRDRVQHYLVAVAASLVAIAAAAMVQRFAGPNYFFILLTGVGVSAWYGGRDPGLLATFLSVVLSALLFARPGAEVLPPAADLVQLGAFIIAGIVTSELYERLRRSRDRARRSAAERDAILHQMADGVIIADTEGRIVFANGLARRLHPDLRRGSTVDAFIRQGVVRAADGRPLPPGDFALERALRDDTAVRDVLWRLSAPDGDHVVEGSAAPVRVDGEMYGVVLLMRDVTESRSLAAERDRLLGEREASASRSAFFAEASAMLSASLDLGVTLASIARLSVTELADWCMVDLQEGDGTTRRVAVMHADPAKAVFAATLQAHPPTQDHADDLVMRVMTVGEPVVLSPVDEDELRRWARSPEHLEALRAMGTHSVLSVPLAAQGRMLGVITMGTSEASRPLGPADLEVVTELANRAAIAVEHAQLYAAALAGSKAKSDFLAVMSHELRTPLNAIIGYADLLRSGVPEPLPASLRPYVDRTLSASRHLLQLINEVLTFSRIEAGRAHIQLENSELSIILREVRVLLEPLAAEKRLHFTVEWPSEAVVMRTDPRKVRQILVNLTSNAIKFTERGSVSVSSWAEGDDVFFMVSDTGIGIEAEHLEHVFEPFWQVEQRTTRRTGGTGLGLSIVRRLAQLLGGDVHIQSAPGEGTTFTVRLPLRLERRRSREGDDDETGATGGEALGTES